MHKQSFLWFLIFSISLSSQLVADTDAANRKLNEVLTPFTQDGTVAGLVATVADDKGIVAQTVAGLSDVQSNRPMQVDSIFWIASMSKPVTAACVMQLVDEGKLNLNDPISKHLPELAGLKTNDGSPAVITIQHLLTHTSGMAELPSDEAYVDRTLADVTAKYAKVQVLFEPGSKWQYSQTSINTAARIVEVVSGLTFDQYVEKRICEPLKMVDTTFYLSSEQDKRLAKSYDSLQEGGFKEQPIRMLSGFAPTSRDHFPAGNGGLFSTIGDYTRFCQMLLNEGEWDGKRILSPTAVQTMRTIATGELQTGFTPGNGWGIGCCVVREPQGATASLSPGSFGHGGAYGTQAWIDPVQKKVYVLMVQRSNFPNSDASKLREALQSFRD